MTPGTVVLVGRKWSHPDITIDVSVEGIAIGMTMADFLAALVVEMGSPALLFSQVALEQRIRVAAEQVVAGMKEETARIA